MYFFQRKGYKWSFFALIFTYKRQLEGVWHFWFMTFFFVQTLWLHCLRACSMMEEKSEVTIGICQDLSTCGSLFIAFSGVLWTMLVLFRFSLDQESIFSFTKVYSMYDKLHIFKVQFGELWHTSTSVTPSPKSRWRMCLPPRKFVLSYNTSSLLRQLLICFLSLRISLHFLEMESYHMYFFILFLLLSIIFLRFIRLACTNSLFPFYCWVLDHMFIQSRYWTLACF